MLFRDLIKKEEKKSKNERNARNVFYICEITGFALAQFRFPPTIKIPMDLNRSYKYSFVEEIFNFHYTSNLSFILFSFRKTIKLLI